MRNRKIERILLLCVTLIMLIMALRYYWNIKYDLYEAEGNLNSGQAVNLKSPLQVKNLKKILGQSGYFTDANYVNFIATQIQKIVAEQGELKNLGALNKKGAMISAVSFTKTGSESGELRFINSIAHLGMDSAFYALEQKNPQPYPATVQVAKTKSNISIKGSISFDDEKQISTKGVLVKLTEVYPQVFYDTASVVPDKTEFFARTNEDGKFQFDNVKEGANYSVLPIKPGYEFGAARGKAGVTKGLKFNFIGKPHLLKILDNTEYRQLKGDKVFVVRTPNDFIKNFVWALLLFVASFWMAHFVFSYKKLHSDAFILPLLMFLSGIGLMILYSIQDPLRDEIFGWQMALSVSFVLLAFSGVVIFLRKLSILPFYHSKWFDPLHQFYGKSNKSPRGYSWLVLSIAIMLLLAVFGSGPEGSGVKVNLFGFQVSELAKLLMIVFFATFFTVNAGYFRNIKDNKWLIKNSMGMLLLFGFLILVYALLGDLGPAVVLSLTFLFFYAFAKAEFLQMIIGAVGYAVLLVILNKLLPNTDSNYLVWVAITACIATLGYAYFSKKNESVFFIVLIISSFIILASFPFDFTQRLADRNSMFQNMWENNLIGGDQVAQGIWALNTGEYFGQGLGKGMSNVMPAYHTDMIMLSIGEEIGLLSLVAIFLAFLLLLYRTMLSSRRTGKPFLFYLGAGIGIATLLQFAIIVAGTLGLLPLTGISVPFLSKGNASIMITIFSFLLVLLLSHEKGDALEMDEVKKNFDTVNASAILVFGFVIIVFIGSLFWYQFKSNQSIVKPALVLNKQGIFHYAYNPRIGIISREITPGNILDRNGLVIASSDKELIKANRNKLMAAGATASVLNEQIEYNKKRIYPFTTNLLFWLGDINKEIAKEENNGYAAEYRHLSLLKGFDITTTTTQKTSDRYRESKFLPMAKKESELTLYDYSVFAPLIKAGKSSSLIDAQNKLKKDIQLSLDVVMNEKINSLIQSNPAYNSFRTSIVAINAKTGEVLASAVNPPPSYKNQKLISNIDPQEYGQIFREIFGDRMVVPQDMALTYTSRPGSTVKIIDAYAAMNQYGLAATNFMYHIYPQEVIRQGEPVNEDINMKTAIIRSSNVYFIKLANEKKLEKSLLSMYDKLGMNILNRGGFNFQRPDNYNSELYKKEWGQFLSIKKNLYYNKSLSNTRKRFETNYSNIAWGQGELMATPLHLAKMSGAIANNGSLQPSKFLIKSWNSQLANQQPVELAMSQGMNGFLAEAMKEQSANVSAAVGLEIRGKTGSPERDKYVKVGKKLVKKRVTDAWYIFYVFSPRYKAPVAFTIRIEQIGNSDFAKELAKDMLSQLKSLGYF